MKKIYQLLILGLLLFSFQTLIAQTKTVEAEGTWQIANVTPEKARMLALQRAKDEALQKAGIETFISTSTYTVTDLIQNFMHFSNSEIIGEFTNIEILEDDHVNINGILFWKVLIKAKINISGKVKPDPEFDAQINGIAATYNAGDKLEFTLKLTKDCYVQIFWFNDAGNGALFYPNEYESMQLLKAKMEHRFPFSDKIESYDLYKETKEDTESNNFVFVFTKKEVAYPKAAIDGTTTLDDLYDWIIKIPADQRLTKQEVIFIGKKRK